MTLQLPSDLTAAVEGFLASGGYKDEMDVLRDALAALRHRANVAAIQEGIDDMEAGRGRPWEEVAAEIRKEFGFKAS